jgi:non-specific serine/threonine protein kinase
LLGSSRLLTVVGTGGVGKTRLAAQLSRLAMRAFHDGIVWVELAAHRDPASIASVVAGAAGVDPGDRPAGEAVTAYLSSRELLVVLDNCEHLLEACGDLVSSWMTDAPRVRVVVTSRQPLRVAGEQLMDLQPLALPTPADAARGSIGHVEAVALLVDRARAVHNDFRVDAANSELVARLCQRLDGIPLAIELAAARLRVLSVGQLVDRLDERFEVLTTGLRSALPRHQTLRGLVEWSHELCSPAEQALWAQLSVFDGDADLEAIEAVCEVPGSSMEVVAGLVDKSVLATTHLGDQVRYRMLETIRRYGAERLADCAEADDVRRRHRDHYVSMARAAADAWFGPDQVIWLERIRADLGNLRGAFEHSLAHQADRSAALTLLSSLEWFMPNAGLLEEATRWCNRALAEPLEPSSALLPALTSAAYLADIRSDVATSALLARRAGRLTVTDETPGDRAARHRALGLLATHEGDHERALAERLRSLAEYASDNVGRQVEELQNVALITAFLGRPGDATAYLDKALRLCDERGDRIERFYVLCVYANVLEQLGRHEEALDFLSRSLVESPVLRASDMTEPMSHSNAGQLDERRAAVLLGVRGRLWHDAGYQTGVYSQGGYSAMEQRFTATLGEEEFQAAYDEGFAMTRASAMRFVRGEAAGSSRSAVRTGHHAPGSLLTRREREVAALIARGLSNRDIAQQLVISQRTAEGHVARIMDKLGVNSRAGIAAWAASGAAGEQNL